MMFMTNMFNQASAVVMIPLWVMDHYNSPVALGWVASALALGAVLGSLLFIGFVKRLPRYLTFVLGYLLGGSPRFLVLGFTDDIRVVLAVTFLAGLAGSVINPVYGALLFERVPRPLQARVFGLAGAMTFGGIPLGGLVGAWLVQSFGLDMSLVVAGFCFLGITLSPIIGYRIWKQMDVPPPDPDKPGSQAAPPLPDWIESLGLLSKRTLPAAVTGVLQAPIIVTLSYMDGDVDCRGRPGQKPDSATDPDQLGQGAANGEGARPARHLRVRGAGAQRRHGRCRRADKAAAR